MSGITQVGGDGSGGGVGKGGGDSIIDGGCGAGKSNGMKVAFTGLSRGPWADKKAHNECRRW